MLFRQRTEVEHVKRRDLIRSAVAIGAAATWPARVVGLEPAATSPAAPLPGALLPTPGAAPSPAVAYTSSRYQRRILDAAAAQKQRLGARLWHSDVIGVADFALPSSEPRLHFANLENGTVRSFYVAHGRGSDPEHDGWLKTFSNAFGSEATSRGAYLTCEWYSGKYGTSIRLQGFDADNSNALERQIVMHPAWYAAPEMVEKWGKLGRSEGCFAMAPDQFNEALWHLSGGRLLYADRIGA
jgi:L,D-transpeptidase catalytic domain